ncbi:zinc finger SWIM domain-containing 7 [Micractinium conductrix]|uniref:Zinc finger SWIM domain-containing 7 n=1 Tax=Micractinium conductrix TaxID=554055 RepID=A0A2P6VGV3_9CHLO|nr:zinc finger SWIM domain-containing 7 [Micractinium conductrix]|eukprot:PSC73313.1 zinc finger SWIM domain-containing 7 [Micractinium conductrix]
MQRGSVELLGSELLASVAAAGSATDEQLSALHFLFDTHVAKALQIVDQGGVWCFVGAGSGRRVFKVQGQSAEAYVVFPGHYCSCQAFFFDVVSKEDAVTCKHQLAARLADALGKARVQTQHCLPSCMARLAARALAAAALGSFRDVDEDEGTVDRAGSLGDSGGAAADLQADLLLAAQEQLVQEQQRAEQHDTVNAFHAHLQHAHSGRRAGSAAGIIWLLILLHLAFIGYWSWIWWRQRRQREAGSGRKPCAPQKVNCVYDWTPVIPQLPNIQLAKTAQH